MPQELLPLRPRVKATRKLANGNATPSWTDAMFDIKTSNDFFAKVLADFEDYERDPASSRLGLNCAMSAYHLHEWVWGD